MAASSSRLNPLRWFSGISNRWKLTMGTMICAPVMWELNEHRKVRQKRIFYNEAIKDLVFLDFAVANRYIGRVLIGLYTDQVPLSVENFVQLCEGYVVRDKIIGYKNTQIHGVFPRIGLMGGDVITGKGTHQLSIYGPTFPDENFDMEFIQDGDVALCNSGPHSNSSHFMITFSPLKVLHGQNVVIGTVLKGMQVIRKVGEFLQWRKFIFLYLKKFEMQNVKKQGNIESLGSRQGSPAETIRIIHCGLYKGKQSGMPFYTVPDSDTMEEQILSEEDFLKLSKEEQETRVVASRPLRSHKSSLPRSPSSPSIPIKEKETTSYTISQKETPDAATSSP
ncbi:putative cyclophilin [Cardiosporidium cionae]|uniref:Cyclophilin n=1 Tax=Cardiosporidium cionae TaxID=476202 RepID=A0ABQ7J7M1_9APIC|nr:putative cyclophilin [Cardiosporidium cionae]|eukprot:KAF8819948.1 putative cyclophilin [Cardiosporidium cionae]